MATGTIIHPGQDTVKMSQTRIRTQVVCSVSMINFRRATKKPLCFVESEAVVQDSEADE